MRFQTNLAPSQEPLAVDLTWPAKLLTVMNPSEYPLFVNYGSQFPTATDYDLQIPSGVILTVPCYGPTYRFKYGNQAGVVVPATLSVTTKVSTIILQSAEERSPTFGMASLPFPPTYYDRHPLVLPFQYQGTIAPAGVTTRWSYTVPANRLAFVEFCFTIVLRATVAAPADVAQANVIYSNGSAQAALAIAMILNNTVGMQDQSLGNNYGLMVAGDTLLGQSVDLSTGGTVFYDITAKVCEFDA